jgi:hypothetical protein
LLALAEVREGKFMGREFSTEESIDYFVNALPKRST